MFVEIKVTVEQAPNGGRTEVLECVKAIQRSVNNITAMYIVKCEQAAVLYEAQH